MPCYSHSLFLLIIWLYYYYYLTIVSKTIDTYGYVPRILTVVVCDTIQAPCYSNVSAPSQWAQADLIGAPVGWIRLPGIIRCIARWISVAMTTTTTAEIDNWFVRDRHSGLLVIVARAMKTFWRNEKETRGKKSVGYTNYASSRTARSTPVSASSANRVRVVG